MIFNSLEIKELCANIYIQWLEHLNITPSSTRKVLCANQSVSIYLQNTQANYYWPNGFSKSNNIHWSKEI